MPAHASRGRPRKYGRPARAVTVTLPEDTLDRLARVHTDVGSAIVKVVERATPTRAAPMRAAEISSYGRHSVIIVSPSPVLKKLAGVELVPVGDGRALISLLPSTSITALELQLRDALEHLARDSRERELLQSLADILKRSRGAQGMTSEARTIIVLASKRKRRVS